MELSIWVPTQEIESTSWWALATCTATFCGWHLPKARCVPWYSGNQKKRRTAPCFLAVLKFQGFLCPGISWNFGDKMKSSDENRIFNLHMAQFDVNCRSCFFKESHTDDWHRTCSSDTLFLYTTTLGVSVDSEGQHDVCCWYILIPSGLRWSPADCIQPTFMASSHHISPWQTQMPLMAPAATPQRGL